MRRWTLSGMLPGSVGDPLCSRRMASGCKCQGEAVSDNGRHEDGQVGLISRKLSEKGYLEEATVQNVAEGWHCACQA